MTRAIAGQPAAALRAELGRELLAAAGALAQVRTGHRLPLAIAQAQEADGLPFASHGAIQEFAYHAVRWLGSCEAIASRLNSRPAAPRVAALQLVALSQLLQPGRRHEAVIVDQVVKAANGASSLRAAAPFLNATLRRFLRERDALLQAATNTPEGRWNHPAWWVDQLIRDHPAQWEQILRTNNQPAPMTLRVNRRRTDVQTYLRLLGEARMTGTVIGPQAIRLQAACDVDQLPGFSDGMVSVQDLAAQLAAPLLGPSDGMRVLDACAAPGGKSTHLLELADCQLTALELDPQRLTRVDQNLARLGLRAKLIAADALDPQAWWDRKPFQRILLDAPCSASGIVRRHPEIRWLRRRRDLATLSQQQGKMLAALWPLLEPGGKLLYATCSVFRAEGEQVVGRFVAGQADALREPLAWHWPGEERSSPLAQLVPRPEPLHDHDGFFYALIAKRP
ncbi:MAG: 16S rRNA (cytosine(967)-C(5))-methyltransferase RsmB [Quisquiliibacterium sp.]